MSRIMKFLDWFLAAIIFFTIAVLALTVWPHASMRDGDIQQPESYSSHVIPDEESAEPEEIPELLTDEENTLDSSNTDESDVFDDQADIDYTDQWYIPPEAYNSYEVTPENTPQSVVPVLGYSGTSEAVAEPMTELEHLAAINTNVSMIFESIILIIAIAFVCFIWRIVWPLFKGL